MPQPRVAEGDPPKRLFVPHGSGYWRRWMQALRSLIENHYLDIAIVLVFATIYFNVHRDEEHR